MQSERMPFPAKVQMGFYVSFQNPMGCTACVSYVGLIFFSLNRGMSYTNMSCDTVVRLFHP